MGFLSWLKRLLPRGDDRQARDEVDEDVDPWDPFPDSSAIPVRDELDLHGLPPRMVRELVGEYLLEARRLGFRHVRIVHGKGIGVQREIVRSILQQTPWVEDFGDAPPERGGWGATVALLTVASPGMGEDDDRKRGDDWLHGRFNGRV